MQKRTALGGSQPIYVQAVVAFYERRRDCGVPGITPATRDDVIPATCRHHRRDVLAGIRRVLYTIGVAPRLLWRDSGDLFKLNDVWYGWSAISGVGVASWRNGWRHLSAARRKRRQ